MPTNDILLVDDDPSTIQLMGRILSDLAPLRFATNGAEALRLVREAQPDLILLDAEMPGMSGFQVCEALKADPELARIPVVFVTSHHESNFEVAGFEIGAADFIAKPVSPPLVLARAQAQLRFKRMADELHRISRIDALTGVANRRSFDEALAREWLRAQRSNEAVALLLVDVDHFKLFNDHYGHQAGDVCLAAVAKALERAFLRPADMVARYGGEEFAVLLPATAREGAQHMAHRVLDAVEALTIPHARSATSRHVTVSVGLAVYDKGSACWGVRAGDSRFGNDTQARRTPGNLVSAADKALYAAKRGGRAQAHLLDICDVNTPARARELARALRPVGAGVDE